MIHPTHVLTDLPQWEKIRNEEKSALQDENSATDEFMEALDDEHVEVHVSEVDRDPYGIMISKAEI